MANQASCEWWQVGCKIGDGLKNLADSAITEFVKSLYEGALAFVAQVSTFWMDTPSPDVDNAAVASLRADMSWYVAGFAILGFLLGLIKLIISQDVKNSLIGLATPIVNLILATAVYAAGIGLLLTASDEFSKWIVQRSTGGEIDLTQMLTSGTALLASPGTAFLLFLLLLLGAVINLLFMYFRDVMFLILSTFIVALAAASGSEQGRQAWRKANGWLIALLLFKPVAAGIYSLGFRMLVQGSAPEGEEATIPEAMHSTLIALLILLLAALALPALVKFIVPAAGAGAGAFSGGAALGAGVTLAAGAAVLAGTGGAAAAAGGAGAAMSGAAGAGGGSVSAGSTAAGAAGGGAGLGSGSVGSSGGGGPAGGAPSGGLGSGGSGAAGASSGADAGSSASGSASGDSGSSSGSAGSSSTGSSSLASESGAVNGPAAGGSSSTGATAGTGSAAPASGSDSGPRSSQSSHPSGSGAPVGGPSGAKPGPKASDAMQKMGDVKGLADGANPSKLVDEDGD